MKEKKITLTEKFEIQARTIGQNQQEIEELKSQDRQIRDQFTKVLGSTRLGGELYSYSGTAQRTLSWEEIFFQCGLISARMFTNEIRNDMNDFQQRISKLESKPE